MVNTYWLFDKKGTSHTESKNRVRWKDRLWRETTQAKSQPMRAEKLFERRYVKITP
jgi:hypothetical protein